jgi:uncharacterized protein
LSASERAATWRWPPWVAFLVAVVSLAAPAARAEEKLPPKPARWVTDRAGVLSPGAAAAIDQKLEAFEKAQGSQVLVAIFPSLPPDEVLEDWTQRVAESWGVGRAKQDDGVVLFVFVADRKLRIEVGYGLEGALTDLESKTILDDVLVPHLRDGDWDGGISAATDAILEAIRGEYQPEPGASSGRRRRPSGAAFVFFLIVVVLLRLISRRSRRGFWRSGGWGGGGFGGFGGFGGGGFGGGGGFSGGGGSFGGGGASGGW